MVIFASLIDCYISDFQKVVTDKPACLAVLKKYKGSRFKAFKTYDEALKFAEAGPPGGSQSSTSGEDGGTWTGVGGEKPSPFRGPKPQDLIKLKKAIEQGDMKYFNQVCLFSFFTDEPYYRGIT